MYNSITANELKIKGVSVLDQAISLDNEAVITVRGKRKYIVLSIDEYNRLRECELEAALIEAKNDLAEGKFHSDSVEDHINRLTNA